MIKQTPRPAQLAAMVAFALSCFGLLLFMWLRFGGVIPLKAESYRFQVAVPEAVTLPMEADVRLAGVNVGRVKATKLEKGAARTLVEIEMGSEFAPIPRDTRVALREKTLLGETYLELSSGGPSAGMLEDGGRLRDAQVLERVQLDEIFQTFDDETQARLRVVLRETARAVRSRRGEDLNHALGNLAGFTIDGERLFRILDERREDLRQLVKGGGVVLEALSDRRGALRDLIVDSNEVLRTTASRDEALAETVAVLPTFLAETRATLTRLERFSRDTRPRVADLRPVAGDLAPTLRDLGDLAPHLRDAFRDLDPLIRASRNGLPALRRVASGAEPVVEGLGPFLDELNPVLSLLGFYQSRLAGFLSNAAANLNGDFGGERYQIQTGIVDSRSFEYLNRGRRPEWDRGNAYLQPNAFNRALAIGTYESTDCSNAAGPRNRFGDVSPNDALNVPEPAKTSARRAGCAVVGPSLFDRRFFSIPERGRTEVRRPPRGTEGSLPLTTDERPVPPAP
jgi:phospholipid/cholesterol/gamma-HCH transport system substrate-binding protein